MKKIYCYLPIAALAVATASCEGGKKQENAEGQKTFDIANLDTTANKGTSFFDYATGGWVKANPMTDEYSRYGSFDVLRKNNQEQVKGLIEELGKEKHDAGSVGQKIGDLYAIGMDSTKLNTEGAAPIKAQLDEINNASSISDIVNLIGKIRIYGKAPFFGVYVGPDAKNSDINIVNLYQSGLNLGNRDYYMNTDSVSVDIRKSYLVLIKTQYQNIGYTAENAEKTAENILKIETAIAKAHFTKEETRNRDKHYHKMQVSDLKSKVANFGWDTFFEASQLKGFTELNVSHIEPVAASIKLIETLPVDEIKSYLSWCVINSAAGYLSDNFVDANFEFYSKKLQGVKAQQPRWKRVVNVVDGTLSEAVGQMYVAKYFPAEAKERMLKLVDNLQGAFADRITNLSWMSDETKVKAHDKLNAFTVKIGYPDKWKDYTSLKIKNDSYWANLVRSSQFEWDDMAGRIGKPVDKTEWHMPPQMVNAYYNPSSNEICFPAGILQPPFFYLDADDAVNYGAIGVVIGHEMSHGFDDQGAKYDKVGNMVNWWTDEDAAKFKERAQVLVNHFDAIKVLPDLNANGQYTLGENIGDFGGTQVAFHAFSKTEQAKSTSKIDGFTPQQRFFLSYAGLWAGSIRDAEIRRLTSIDVHSLGRWRVDGTLPHIDAWYEAFNITEVDSLFIPKDKRADIW